MACCKVGGSAVGNLRSDDSVQNLVVQTCTKPYLPTGLSPLKIRPSLPSPGSKGVKDLLPILYIGRLFHITESAYE